MTRVELRFPAHRYHGTAWGCHVNEGVPEWPPSPYRLIRGLYDAWQRKCPELSDDAVRGVFAALASAPPVFQMPKTVAAHTRSYLSRNTEDPSEKSLIFDAFVALPPDAPCYIEWAVDLSPGERGVLAELLGALNYLGRSESWVEARMVERNNADLPFRCAPVAGSEGDGELVQVACPVPREQYRGKREWLEAFSYTTTEMFKQRRSEPPAMRNVAYSRPREAVATWLSPARPAKQTGVNAIALSLDSRVLPLATDAVRVAESVRICLMGAHRRLRGGDGSAISEIFSGKDRSGEPLKRHEHLFILPRANGGGRIDRVLLVSRQQDLSGEEIQAVLRVRVLNGFETAPVRVTAVWKGGVDQLAHSAKVVSTTPFVLGRHWRRGRGSIGDFVKGEVRRECLNHGLPEPVAVELRDRIQGRYLPVQFRRNRQREAPAPGYALGVVFPRPVQIPFSLGYACHFGLGQLDAGE